jgi:hypothetical protein
MKASQVVGLVVVALVAILALTWIAQGNDFFLYKAFAPKYEEVRRDTFEQSQAYVQGKITNLNRLRMNYESANSDAHRCAIRATALHEASTATENTLPDDLVTWINRLRRDTSCN